MNRAIVMHRVHPVIDQTFPFAEAKEAYSTSKIADTAKSSSRACTRQLARRHKPEPQFRHGHGVVDNRRLCEQAGGGRELTGPGDHRQAFLALRVGDNFRRPIKC
jgi:hypothetical protein